MAGISDNDFRAEFEHNFDVSTVESPSDKSKDEEALGGSRRSGKSSGTDDLSDVTSDDNMEAIYLEAMMASYNTQTDDMMNKADAMESENDEADEMSEAESAVTSAQMYASENGNGDITIKVSDSATSASSNGSTVTLTEAQAEMLNNNGMNISNGTTVSSDDISDLTSTMSDIEETYSGNSEYTLLEVQLDTQNMSQDSDMATDGLKTIGDTQTAAAQNV
jgi:hypothetical protein